jgi:hypothetical protein
MNQRTKDVPPSAYWSHSTDLDPNAMIHQGRRVVITAFAVELVDLQFQPRLPRQPILKPMPLYAGGLWFTAIPGVALEVIGVGRRCTPFAESDQQLLTTQLYEAFEADLRARGLEVVQREVVIASPGNQSRPQQPVSKSSLLMILSPLGSDTGAVLHSRTMSEPGLGRGSSRWSHRPNQADLQILAETGADVALDIRLRVGTYRTKAALEHRSIIRMTTPDDMITLKAKHSILSDADVTTESRFIPIKGRVVPVDPGLFAQELKSILPKFISLALLPPTN